MKNWTILVPQNVALALVLAAGCLHRIRSALGRHQSGCRLALDDPGWPEPNQDLTTRPSAAGGLASVFRCAQHPLPASLSGLGQRGNRREFISCLWGARPGPGDKEPYYSRSRRVLRTPCSVERKKNIPKEELEPAQAPQTGLTGVLQDRSLACPHCTGRHLSVVAAAVVCSCGPFTSRPSPVACECCGPTPGPAGVANACPGAASHGPWPGVCRRWVCRNTSTSSGHWCV